ncbi:MAG: signal peptide peptidase SppA [Anaerolineaceae bacterium]
MHISRQLMDTPWAILPVKLEAILEVVNRYLAGEKLNAEQIQAQINGATKPSERISGSIAVLPLFGTLVPRASLFTETSGATSAEQFGKRFDQLVEDPSVGAIVIDVDSPGGQVQGIEELSKKIYDARGKKPIIAVANHLAASAAYWIATAADELVVTPSGEVGSIGVFAVHEDESERNAKDGIKVTMISEGKYKTEGNPYEPLSEEARSTIQERVSEVYDLFIRAVARNRGVKPAEVREGFGEGRVVASKKAVQMGMADRIATLDETIARLQKSSGRRGVSADVDFRKRRMRLNENSGSVEPEKTAP